MKHNLEITNLHGRQILDSRGNPTVEVEVTIDDKYIERASVPSGASTGQFEAIELRDGEKEYSGLGVKQAVWNVNHRIRDILIGKSASSQMEVDRLLIEADGTENKHNLGSNAVLGTSIAVARTVAKSKHVPLYEHLGGAYTCQLPMPMMNIVNGGCHADNPLDVQEFMILPIGAKNFQEALRMGTEVYHHLRQTLQSKGMYTGIGDEGGFAPALYSVEDVMNLLMHAVDSADLEPGKDVVFAMDVAASELYVEKEKKYFFPGESTSMETEIYRTSEDMIEYFEALIDQFPIVSIEDGLAEEDWDGHCLMTRRLGERIQLVGDDLFVTNAKRLKKGISLHAANAILIKPNQVGTLTETLETIELAKKGGYGTVISHRSGETMDSIIADLSVAVNAGQIKTGAPCRGERTEKYNQLLRIEESLGRNASFQC